jgi:hypothetical protein
MASMKPEVISYNHINNISECNKNLESMGSKLFGDKWKGFVKETTFIHSEGFITKKIEPIEGCPAEEFTKLIKSSGIKIPDFSPDSGRMKK